MKLGGQGALRRDTEQGSEFADRQRAGLTFARILVSAASRGRLTALSTTSRASHGTGPRTWDLEHKRAAHPHRLCRTLLNVGEANKHITGAER